VAGETGAAACWGVEGPETSDEGIEGVEGCVKAAMGSAPGKQGVDISGLCAAGLKGGEGLGAGGESGMAALQGGAGRGVPGCGYWCSVAMEEVELKEVGLEAGCLGGGGDVGGEF
jgi:hypothetical protein